jgi:hypothetical protein
VAQCCDDVDNALWLDDFESGAPLAANYVDPETGAGNNPGTHNVTLEAGHGINGSIAAHSDHGTNAGFFATFGKRFPTDLDHCENVRREFAVGGRWNFANTVGTVSSGGFYIMEIRYAAETAFSVYRVLRDIVLYDSNNDEVGRIYNIIPAVAGTYTKIEMRGSISSDNNMLDGWIEFRINDRVYDKNEDAAAVQPGDPPIDCPKGWTELAFDQATIVDGRGAGWDRVIIATQGDFDCYYIFETATFCQEPQILNKPGGKCDPPGPGGSSFDGSASGDRIVHKGGYTTAYVAPTYGGVPATAADPTDAQTLTDAVTPIVSMELTLCDASVKRYAQLPIVHAGASPINGRVMRWGSIPFRLADRFGNLPSQTYEIELDDTDGELRALLATGANRFYTRWEVRVYVESDIARLAGTAKRSLARGRVIAPPVTGDYTVTLVVGDELTRQYGATSLDRELPWVRMRDVFKSGFSATGMIYQQNLPEDFEDEVLPIIYGEASDDIKQQQGITPVGINKTIYAGTFLLKSGSEKWYGFVVSLYAIKAAAGGGLFASNMHPECPGSVRIDPDKYTGDWLVPGLGNWASYFGTNYHDITVGDRTYRVTMIFGRGSVAKQHVDGKVPVSVNAFGIETTGDSSGTLISDAAYILQHQLDHPILRRTTSGNWGAVGAFADGTAKVRTTSALAVKTIHDARITNGYRDRFIMDTARPAKDWLADGGVSFDIRTYVNHHGQSCFSTFDDAASTSSLTTFTELLHIKKDSFQILPERNGDIENVQPYQYGPEPATGRFVGSDTHKAESAIDDWGEERQADPLVYEGIYTAAVAADVTSRRMFTTVHGITRGVFVIDLAGIDLTPGQLIRLTHSAGFGQLGWTDRVLRVVGVVVNPNVSDPPTDDDLTCTIEWEDVHHLLLYPGSTTVSAIGFHPVGTEAGATALLAGSEADGTAYRAGT